MNDAHPSPIGLDRLGLAAAREVHWNLRPAALCEASVHLGTGRLASTGRARLAQMVRDNFRRYADQTTPAILAAAPRA